MNISSCAITDVGRRTQNEDAILHEPQMGMFAVCDGMGGYSGGEIASALAVEHFRAFMLRFHSDPDSTWPGRSVRSISAEENLLVQGALSAHLAIASARQGPLMSMGSTLVALQLRGETAQIAHVGDSRAYRLRDGALRALTRDHSIYAQLEAMGEVPPRAQFANRNVITRALGIEEAHDADVATTDIQQGDVFLLCSDGLYDPLAEATIIELLNSPTPRDACERLVTAALRAGGTDNLSAIVIKIS